MSDTPMLCSIATVALERPGRFAKQLASHLGHKATVAATEDGWELFFDPSRATVVPQDAGEHPVMVLTVWSPTSEGLVSVQAALERHLQAFTARSGGVEVRWVEA